MQHYLDAFSTWGTDVVSTLCSVENPISDFVSLSRSDQGYFNIDLQRWNYVDPTLKCWSGNCTGLTTSYISEAKLEILMHPQKEMLPTEYKQLQQGQSVNKDIILLPLQPFVSDELIRVGGRLRNSYLPLHCKYQIIIEKIHPLASLLITYIHERNFH